MAALIETPCCLPSGRTPASTPRDGGASKVYGEDVFARLYGEVGHRCRACRRSTTRRSCRLVAACGSAHAAMPATTVVHAEAADAVPRGMRLKISTQRSRRTGRSCFRLRRRRTSMPRPPTLRSSAVGLVPRASTPPTLAGMEVWRRWGTDADCSNNWRCWSRPTVKPGKTGSRRRLTAR